MTKDLEAMNELELKGVMFDLDAQIKQIQNYAQTKVIPLIKKWETERLTQEKEVKNGRNNKTA